MYESVIKPAMIAFFGDASARHPLVDYGILGMVVLALSGVIVSGVKMTLARIDGMVKRHDEALEKRDEAHANERKEWRHSADRNVDKIESAIHRLADAISHWTSN